MKEPQRATSRLSVKQRLVTLVIGSLGFALTVVGIGVHFAAPRYRGPSSDHFDGKRFRNLDPFVEPKWLDVLRWKLFSHHEPWPDWVEFPKAESPVAKVTTGLKVTFINHATFLVQMGGLNILTDPVFSERVGPLGVIGAKRHKAPGIALEALPKIDVVLVSHNHYDHLDLPSIRAIKERDAPLILAGLGNQALFYAEHLENEKDLDLWQSHSHRGVTFTLTPAQHWSARSLGDRFRSLWGGFYVSDGKNRLFFAGDTAMGSHFEQIATRLGPPDLALLPIGAYSPRWFMSPQHLDPEGAVMAHLRLRAKQSVAMHFGCFDLANEGMLDAPADLSHALVAHQVPSSRFVVLEHGASHELP